MAAEVNFEVSNAADFVADISAKDVETLEDIDFTGAAVSIDIWQENYSAKITLSIGSGIVLVSALVLEMTITAAQMAAFCPGSYLIGGTYTLNGSTIQLIRGDFVVYRGHAQ